MSKESRLQEESSRQRRQPVQESCCIRMPGTFKALRKAGVAGCKRYGEAQWGRKVKGHQGPDHAEPWKI